MAWVFKNLLEISILLKMDGIYSFEHKCEGKKVMEYPINN